MTQQEMDKDFNGHFTKEEKHLRYNYLKAELLKKVEEM